MVARDLAQFKQQITNPGPLRVGYSKDYLDWYFKAYQEKVKFAEAKSTGKTPLPTGKLPVVPNSARQRVGDQLRSQGHKLIESGAVQHGLYDLMERQPHFPVIHIDKCEDRHVRELLKDIFFEESISAAAVWEKALLYRAMLHQNKNRYPTSFDYIFPYVDGVHTIEAAAPSAIDGVEERRDPNLEKFPTKDAADYFTYLAKKYHVDHAGDAHVVLQCHAREDATNVLFSNPAPADDEPGTQPPLRPTSYPPLEAMLLDENLALARCLIFAEFNTFVSMNPFVKFPNSRSIITRPVREVSTTMKGMHGAGAARAMAKRRSIGAYALMAPVIEENLDARSREVSKMQQHKAEADGYFTEEIMALAAENPGFYQSDMAYYNPRTVRAELRDMTSRDVARGIRLYKAGRDLAHRAPMSEVEAQQEKADFSPLSSVPLPTVPHFIRLLTADRHVSFAITMSQSEEAAQEVRAAVSRTASQLHRLGLVFHKQYERQVERQKVQIAMQLLDNLVAQRLADLKDLAVRNQVEHLATKLDRLGPITPWVGRPMDQFGYPPEARVDDYNRWMAKPTGLRPE